MSYCRFSEGDVYLYLDIQGFICCCACSLLTQRENAHLYSIEDAIEHVRAHRAAGHKVPLGVEHDLAEDKYARGYLAGWKDAKIYK